MAVLLEDADDLRHAALAELVQSELIDQVMFTPRAEFAFRHPLVQTVAYESQLKFARAQRHRRLSLRLTTEYLGLLDAIGEPELIVGLLYPAIHAKHEARGVTAAVQPAQRVIDLAGGDPTKGNILTDLTSGLRDGDARDSEMRYGTA